MITDGTICPPRRARLLLKGIGPVYANQLVQAFDEAAFDTAEQSPERLREVAGTGPKRAERRPPSAWSAGCVIDGDTIVVGGVHVRLQGVAAPEVAHPGQLQDEPGGPEMAPPVTELPSW